MTNENSLDNIVALDKISTRSEDEMIAIEGGKYYGNALYVNKKKEQFR